VTHLLVTGPTGQLGTEVVDLATAAGHHVTRLGRHEPEPCDLTDADAVHALVTRTRPEVVVHTAAWTAVDDCETDPDRALEVNGRATATLVAAARSVGAHVVYVSTDYVFDGTKATPYTEDDTPNPTSAYGRSKLAGERACAATDTVVRTSWVCGRHGPNMVRTILRLAGEHDRLHFVDDQVGHPTFTADLAPVLLLLGERRAPGTWHVTNQGPVSWYRFAREVLDAAGLDPDRVHPVTTAELDPPRPAPRPANSVLDNAALRAAGLEPPGDFRPPLRALVAELTGQVP
jgi:dTDP-4-dehydrorhamnose reductase